ncbi:MAG: LPS export ABC transporter permease LptF [Rhodospirillales bacterium RIFCSPLOWO2_12_FULL_58_28]|nr:MAG: LPS export ABC transporter permease LptF [Rhodospirillales bacterium RIFCSPLOWO2_02_FULL_58_16]OHC80003.1 MAG: LPS export ABC transporter permease LptF [Rhodospirillales bacterium RIFCSPLOWO2_12_FULL_58_28]
MNKITRYILKQLFVGMVMVTSVLTCIIWLSQSLRFIEMIVNRGLSAGTFTYLTMLLLPNFLSVILPIALFTVVVFVYNKLISDRELVVMRAAGLSQFALAKPALILASFIVICAYALNLFLVPQSYRMFRELQWDIRYSYSHILLQEGAFNTISSDVTVYVRERTKDGQLLGVLVHDQRNPEKPYSLLAERGAMIEGDDGARVVMFNGNRQEIDTQTHQLSILYFDRYIFDMILSGNKAGFREREPRERMIGELFNVANDETVPFVQHGKHIAEAHKRLASPLSNFGLTLAGLACLISGGFSRRSQVNRVVLAVGIMVILQAGALGLDNLVAKETGLVPLMYVYAVLPIIFGYFFMVWTPRRRVLSKEQGA